MANLQLTSITIGSPQPRVLARFYAALLDAEVTVDDDASDDWAQIRTISDVGRITLNFEFEAQWRTPVWPSQPGEQHITQHLDICVDDLAGAVEHALACGARLADVQPQGDVRVMLDPHGHPFCLFIGHQSEEKE